MRTLRDNPRLLCAYRALQMSLFPMAVITLFWKIEIGMSMTEIMVLQGMFGLAMAAFEFPSGYLADRIGYRRTLVLAAAMMVAGWSIYAVAGSFAHVALAELVLGVANSLISGCDSALLYESLREDDREATFGIWAGRQRFWGQFGEGTAAVAAGAMFAAWHRLPFVVEVGVWIGALVLATRLVEPARHRPPLADNWRQVRGMFRYAARDNPRLRAMILTVISLSMASFVPVWTIQIYATDAGLPEAWLGPFWALANYTVAIFSLQSARVAARIGPSKLVLVSIGLIAIGYLGLGLGASFWAALFYLPLTVMRGLHGPALHHEEHRSIPSSDRAGFISLHSLLFRTLFLALGPLVGWMIDRHGQHPVMLGLGAGLVLASTLSWLALRRHLHEV